MWYLCSEPFKTLDEARKRAIEVGRDNYDSIHREGGIVGHCYTGDGLKSELKKTIVQ